MGIQAHILTKKRVDKQKITLVKSSDLEISSYCGSGNGGQARNKVASAIMIRHRESGAIGRCSDSRSQADNKREAFLRMTKTVKFKIWLNRKLYEIEQGETLEKTIEKETSNEFLKYEAKNQDGKWVEVKPNYFDSLESKIEYGP